MPSGPGADKGKFLKMTQAKLQKKKKFIVENPEFKASPWLNKEVRVVKD